MATALSSREQDARVLLNPRARFSPWAILLVIWSLFLFAPGLDTGDLYCNEGLRARIAQEMFESGDWSVPRLYGQPIFTKPPLMYWAICLLSWPFGEVSAASARLPSVLAGLATVALFYWYFRRCLGRRAGFLAALFVPLSIFWLDKVPSAEIDALQVAWVAASILFFLRGLEKEQSETVWYLLAFLCLAGGTLTKWTAPAFFYGTLVPLLWWRGQLFLLFQWRHVVSLILAISLVAGWIGLAIYQTEGGLFWEAVVREAAPRLVPGQNPKPYPWLETLMHPLVFMAAGLPLSLGVVAWIFGKGQGDAAAPARGRRRNEGRSRLLLQALHCWLWPNLLFWTIHPDHTLRNRAPLLPALAGLAVFAFLAWEGGALRMPNWLGRPRHWLVGFLVLWTGLKAIHVHVVLPRRSQERQVREKASALARFLPAQVLLYLFRLKDECLMFYLGQPVERLDGPANLPALGGPFFCILTQEEWEGWNRPRSQLLARLEDGQGAPIYLIQVDEIR